VLSVPDTEAPGAGGPYLQRLLERRTPTAVHFGLDRIRALLEALGEPQRRYRALHVAGTNGKGSVAATAEAILRAGGRRTGLYTSPHLVHVAERIAIDGVPADDELLETAAAEVLRLDHPATRADRQATPTPSAETGQCRFLRVPLAACLPVRSATQTGTGGQAARGTHGIPSPKVS